MKVNKNSRKGHLDIAKAIGLIIVLINHMELSLGGLNRYFGAFYVSEFFLLAGLTFRVKETETTKEFMIKKAKRLLLPYAGYSIFYLIWYGVRAIASGSFQGMDFLKKLIGCIYARNYLFPGKENPVYLMEFMNAPMWFLPALFLSLVLYYLISKYLGKKKVYGVAVAYGAAVVIHYFVPVLLPWSIDTVLAMMPLLYLGEWLGTVEYIEIAKKKWWHVPVVLVIFLLSVYWNGAGNISVGDHGKSMVVFLVASCTGTLLCIQAAYFIEKYLHFLGKPLMIVGMSTLDILCLHLFVFALMQTAFQIVGMDSNNGFVKLIIIIMGLLVPVIFSNIVKLGKKKNKKKD